MLNEGFRKIFWGFIFVFLEIHIMVIDILPDPVGYYLIFTGMNLVNKHFEVGSRGKIMAMVLVYFSLPTVFLQNSTIEQIFGWFLYMSIIEILNLMLAFYIFQIMVSIAAKRKESTLLRRTETTFPVYMVSMILITFFEPFAMNMNRTEGTGLFIFSALFSLVMNIIFLILLSKFGKISEDRIDPYERIGEEADRNGQPIGRIR